MLFGYKSGDLHIGRRVQLVIWLQIMQEWVGIAGVTVCMFSGRTRTRLIDNRRPDDLQHCRVRLYQKPVDQWAEQRFLHGQLVRCYQFRISPS